MSDFRPYDREWSDHFLSQAVERTRAAMNYHRRGDPPGYGLAPLLVDCAMANDGGTAVCAGSAIVVFGVKEVVERVGFDCRVFSVRPALGPDKCSLPATTYVVAVSPGVVLLAAATALALRNAQKNKPLPYVERVTVAEENDV